MDLNQINQNVLNLIKNATNTFSFLKDFTVGSAKDVSITYVNADGSESVKKFPNIAKFTGNVRTSVRDTLQHRFYIDGINGNDNNSGDISNPMKTISAVFNKGYLIAGGSYEIFLSGGQTYELNQRVNIHNIHLKIVSKQDNPDTLISVDAIHNDEINGGFSINGNSMIEFRSCILKPAANDKTNQAAKFIDVTYGNATVLIDNWGVDKSINAIVLNTQKLIFVYQGLGHCDLLIRNTKITRTNNTDKLVNFLGSGTLNIAGVSLNNINDFKDIVAGRKFNANDTQPFNITANIDLGA